MRAIDADALIPMMKYATTDNEIGVFPIKIGFDAIVKVINDSPTIEPQRTGRWILVNDNNGQHFVCEFCGEWKYHQKQKFCGECGARMVEVEHE